jgi:hypothetical protein
MEDVWMDADLPAVNDLDVVTEIAEAELRHLQKLRNEYASKQRPSRPSAPVTVAPSVRKLPVQLDLKVVDDAVVVCLDVMEVGLHCPKTPSSPHTCI